MDKKLDYTNQGTLFTSLGRMVEEMCVDYMIVCRRLDKLELNIISIIEKINQLEMKNNTYNNTSIDNTNINSTDINNANINNTNIGK